MPKTEGLAFAEAVINVVGDVSAVVAAQAETLRVVSETQLLIAQFIQHVQNEANATAKAVTGLVTEIRKTQMLVAKRRAEHTAAMAAAAGRIANS